MPSECADSVPFEDSIHGNLVSSLVGAGHCYACLSFLSGPNHFLDSRWILELVILIIFVIYAR